MVDMKENNTSHNNGQQQQQQMNDTKNLMEALDFAAIKHSDQRRKDPEKTPYINHPIGVANIISKEANIHDVDILIAAVLHDTVEDTDTSFEEIEAKFGKKIRDIVDECSDDKTLHVYERKRLQIVHAPYCTYEAKIVKLADKLYNLRDLLRSTPVGWTEKRVQEYFVWAAKVVKGLRGSCNSLEEELDKLFVKRNVIIK